MGAEGGERSMGRVAAGGVEIPPPLIPPAPLQALWQLRACGVGWWMGSSAQGVCGAVGWGCGREERREERGEEGIIMAAGAGRRSAPLPLTHVPVQERPHVPTWDDVPRPTVE